MFYYFFLLLSFAGKLCCAPEIGSKLKTDFSKIIGKEKKYPGKF